MVIKLCVVKEMSNNCIHWTRICYLYGLFVVAFNLAIRTMAYELRATDTTRYWFTSFFCSYFSIFVQLAITSDWFYVSPCYWIWILPMEFVLKTHFIVWKSSFCQRYSVATKPIGIYGLIHFKERKKKPKLHKIWVNVRLNIGLVIMKPEQHISIVCTSSMLHIFFCFSFCFLNLKTKKKTRHITQYFKIKCIEIQSLYFAVIWNDQNRKRCNNKCDQTIAIDTNHRFMVMLHSNQTANSIFFGVSFTIPSLHLSYSQSQNKNKNKSILFSPVVEISCNFPAKQEEKRK